jgi:CheY-like chemotaxis protein
MSNPSIPATTPKGDEESPRGPSPASGGCVLVIDDEETVRMVLARLLEQKGYTTRAAGDGAEGLALFRENPAGYVAVILDRSMPGMDGAEVFAELRRLRPDLPVVLASGYDPRDGVAGSVGERHSAFVQKPFRLADILRALRETIGGAP